MRTLVNFVNGKFITKDGNNFIFSQFNIPIPRIGEKMQFPPKYWNKMGVNCYTIIDIVYSYQDDDVKSVIIWVFVTMEN